MASKKKDPPSPPPTLDGLEDPESAPEIEPTPIVSVGTTAARGLGYKPDTKDERDYSARAMLGARRTLAPEASLEQFATVEHQSYTSSCVGQAIGNAIEVRLRKLGQVVSKVSRQAIYTIARALARLVKDDPLNDTGSHPRLAMKGLREWGVPSERTWPFDPSKINQDLPWDVLQEASVARLTAWYRIDSGGRDRALDIAHAISQGYPVVFGTQVDNAFLNHAGREPVGPAAGPMVGGHMMCIVGYRTVNGMLQFRVLSSWGTGWGDGGFFWATEEFITDANAGDFYVLVVGGL